MELINLKARRIILRTLSTSYGVVLLSAIVPKDRSLKMVYVIFKDILSIWTQRSFLYNERRNTLCIILVCVCVCVSGWYVIWTLFLKKFKFVRELLGSSDSDVDASADKTRRPKTKIRRDWRVVPGFHANRLLIFKAVLENVYLIVSLFL